MAFCKKVFKTKVISGDFLLAQRVIYADTFAKRLKGLLFKKSMDKDCALLIKPCKQIHTFGMNFNIDVLFLSKDFKVLEILQNFMPGRISKHIKESVYVLELAGGTVSGKVQAGETIKILNFQTEKRR